MFLIGFRVNYADELFSEHTGKRTDSFPERLSVCAASGIFKYGKI